MCDWLHCKLSYVQQMLTLMRNLPGTTFTKTIKPIMNISCCFSWVLFWKAVHLCTANMIALKLLGTIFENYLYLSVCTQHIGPHFLSRLSECAKPGTWPGYLFSMNHWLCYCVRKKALCVLKAVVNQAHSVVLGLHKAHSHTRNQDVKMTKWSRAIPMESL